MTDVKSTAALRDTWKHRFLRWRWLLGFITVLFLFGLMAALIAGRINYPAYHPESPNAEGTKALISTLAAHGVHTTVVSRVHDIDTSQGSTIVVLNGHILSPANVSRLVSTGADLVFLGELGGNTSVLSEDISLDFLSGQPVAALDADCDDVAAQAAHTISSPTTGVTVRDGAIETRGCFPLRPGESSYAMVRVAANADHGRLTILTNPEILTNASLALHGHAALGQHLLGQHREIIWLMGSPLDADQASFTKDKRNPLALSAQWWAFIVVLMVGFLWVAVAKGRRLGPLVAEPLPVIVRSVETAEGRAALYRRAKAYDRAALMLRTAAVTRLSRRLAVPRSGSVHDVVAAVHSQLPDQSEQLLLETLASRPATSARQVANLASDLDRLEREVSSQLSSCSPTHRKASQ